MMINLLFCFGDKSFECHCDSGWLAARKGRRRQIFDEKGKQKKTVDMFFLSISGLEKTVVVAKYGPRQIRLRAA